MRKDIDILSFDTYLCVRLIRIFAYGQLFYLIGKIPRAARSNSQEESPK